jgi:sec-independent protein translocase protein TatA
MPSTGAGELVILMFGLPGGTEWVILAIIALLVFGGAKIANVGKNAGKAIREFKEETAAIKKDGKDEPTKDSTDSTDSTDKD